MSGKVIVQAGIDVSAKELTVAASRDGQLFGRRSFNNTTAGHRQLLRWLGDGETEQISVCLEATGIYGLSACLTLAEAGVAVMVLNPRVSADYAKARMQRSKTDLADADLLLDYLQRMPFVEWTAPTPERLALRAMLRRIAALQRMIVQEKNRRAAAEAAKELTDLIRNDIEVMIRHLERRIDRMKEQALEIVKRHQDLQHCYQLLQTISGIGSVTALQLTAELLMLPADMTARQLVAYSGLDPKHHESGTSVHRPARISKAGNRYIRAALFLPAFAAIRHDQYVQAFYQRLLARGKKPLAATIAVMRKLLHAIHGVLASQPPFDSSRFTRLSP
ncbi:MAG: IS110 family transposase [Acidobacteria bacterium]|nr:IS110 family transposase [Acidobacteriota bacterium]